MIEIHIYKFLKLQKFFSFKLLQKPQPFPHFAEFSFPKEDLPGKHRPEDQRTPIIFQVRNDF